MPIATMALTMPGPKTAVIMIADRIAGKASEKSASRMIVSSTQPRRAAASRPSPVPTTRPMPTATTPTRIEARAPTSNREATSRPTVLRAHGVEIDFEHRLVRRGNEEAHLTRKEFDVLSALAAHPGRVVTHQRILEAAWPTDHDRRIEYLRIVVRNLRQKLEGTGGVGTVIANELGIGYRLLVDA